MTQGEVVVPERDETFDASVGRAVKVLRTERDLERKDLAQRAGISYSYLAEIENGAKPASSRVLLAVADALGIELHQLVAYAQRLATAGPPEATVATPRALYQAPAPPASPPAAASAPLAAPAAGAAPSPQAPTAAPRGRWFHAARADTPSHEAAREGRDDDAAALAAMIVALDPDERRLVRDLVERLFDRG